MDREQNIEYVRAQTVAAMCELEAMKAENRTHKVQKQSLAYGYKDFMNLIDKYQLSHNAVITNLVGH